MAAILGAVATEAPLTETASCYRHSGRTAAVGCQRCGRPICAECMHQAAVGFHCPSCTKAGSQKVYRPGDLISQPVVTYAIMALCGAAFLGQLATDDQLTVDGLLWGPVVAQGEWWRIITSAFLHDGLMHIGFNMYALYIFGPMIERAVGWLRFLLIYAGGLLGASVAVMAFNFEQATLGASGAVLGLAGGVAAILTARGQSIFQTSLGGIFLLNLALPLIPGINISFWGHFGGIVGGFLVAAVLSMGPARLGPKGESASQAIAVGLVLAMAAGAWLVAGSGGLAVIDI